MLEQLQRTMMKVLRARQVAPALRELGDEGRALEEAVAGDERLDAAGRLQIYADMVAVRLRDALAATYPKLEKLLGCEEFTALAERYLEVFPSRHPSLRWVGRHLPEFLARTIHGPTEHGRRGASSRRSDEGIGRWPTTEERRTDAPQIGGQATEAHGLSGLYGWQAELAALEWARHDVFDAVDEPVLDAETIGRFGAERIGELPVELVSAHRVVETRSAVETVWRGEAAEPAPEARTLIVWRDGVSVFHRPVGETERLGLAAAGGTFASLCEALAEELDPDDVAREAGALLGRWIGDRLLRNSGM